MKNNEHENKVKNYKWNGVEYKDRAEEEKEILPYPAIADESFHLICEQQTCRH